MSDPAEDICEALTTYVGGLASPVLSLKAAVRKTDDPMGELKVEHQQLEVLFHVASEEAEKIDRGGTCFESFTISMLVIRKQDDEFTRPVMAQFTREIKRAVRGVIQAGYHWSRDETPVKFDAQQYHELTQYCSKSEFTYIGTG